jgi:collagenase-like PrtC family protease
MKRSKFETLFNKLGLALSSYQDAAYYGASDTCSLVLAPFATEDISRAKLAVKTGERDRRVVVNTFLTAAGIDRVGQISDAVEAGEELRAKVGDKEVTLTSFGSELVLNVQSWDDEPALA